MDQNKWIDLFDIKTGKKSDKMLKNLLNMIEDNRDQKNLVFPFSMIHFIETASHENKTKRNEMIDFMWEISNGYTIKNYHYTTLPEIFNYIGYRTSRLPQLNMQEIVIKKGFPYAFGEYTIKTGENLSKEDKNKIKKETKKMVNSKEAFRKLIFSTDFLEELPRRDYEEAHANELERLRKRADNLDQSEKYRWNSGMVGQFKADILPTFIEICYSLNINPFNLFNFDYYLTGPLSENYRISKLTLASFPSFYCFSALTFRRDIRGVPIEPNMTNDIMFLSVAIPYCDIVVTEKFFTGVAKQENLHEIYNTRITSKLRDISDLI